jgi:glucose-1-phosphatase
LLPAIPLALAKHEQKLYTTLWPTFGNSSTLTNKGNGMINAVLIDFGNVMAWFDYSKAYRAIAGMDSNVSEQDVRQVTEDGLLLRRLESGQITDHQFLEALRHKLHLRHAAHSDLTAAWANIFTANEPVLEAIKAIRRPTRLILASNTNGLHRQHFVQQFARTFNRFDALVCSYEIGIMKPQRAFFQTCLDTAECPVDECLYFDDIPEYVAAANKLGIHGVAYAPDVDLKAELAERGVEFI